nr:MAG TPA_asm: hypothetical protein [Inoviridae sp.]DAO56430.1 MAG TPA: hypothetical protein [Inoviridae sp.]
MHRALSAPPSLAGGSHYERYQKCAGTDFRQGYLLNTCADDDI